MPALPSRRYVTDTEEELPGKAMVPYQAPAATYANEE
ncbi:unnamed protein product, partial [marine sediment metagenome]